MSRNPNVNGEWSKLINGKTIGKRMVTIFDPAKGAINSPLDIFKLEGDDDCALDLRVLLCEPQIVDVPPASFPTDTQKITGEMDNEMVLTAAPGFLYVPVIGILEWGIGGAQARAEIDFINGSDIKISASFIRLKAQLDPESVGLGAIAAHRPYVLRAFVGPGGDNGGSRAQRTIRLAAVGVGASSPIFAIPKYAKMVSLMAQGLSNAINWELRFFRDPAGAALIGHYQFNALSNSAVFQTIGTPYSIPNGAQYFRFTSNAVASNNIEVIFDLSL